MRLYWRPARVLRLKTVFTGNRPKRQEGYRKDTRRIQEGFRKDTGRIKEKHKKDKGRLKILKIQQKYLVPNLSERAGPNTLPKKSPEEKDQILFKAILKLIVEFYLLKRLKGRVNLVES